MKNLRFGKDVIVAVAVCSLTACSTQKKESLQPLDDVMMQAFYWDVPVDDQAKNGTCGRPFPQRETGASMTAAMASTTIMTSATMSRRARWKRATAVVPNWSR